MKMCNEVILTKEIFHVFFGENVVREKDVVVPFVLVDLALQELEPSVLLDGGFELVETLFSLLHAVGGVDEKLDRNLKI